MTNSLNTYFAEFLRSAKKCHQEAIDLFNEASFFYDQGMFSRASALHQMSIEACAKVDILLILGASCFTELHYSSNTIANTRDVDQSTAHWAEDVNTAIETLGARFFDYYRSSDNPQNMPLYYAFQGVEAEAQQLPMTAEVVGEMGDKNADCLPLNAKKIALLSTWEKDSEKAREQAQPFVDSVQKLYTDEAENSPNQIIALMQTYLNDISLK